MSVQTNVARGAAKLTEHFGDESWKDQIDPETLEIWSVYRCVLGQLFGTPNWPGFVDGMDVLFGFQWPERILPEEYGFSCPTDQELEYKQAWVELVTGEHAENCDA
jgi:hypothetical protein